LYERRRVTTMARRQTTRRALLAALAAVPLAGCTGGERATPTPTPEPLALPYASDDPAENLERARGFSVQNRTGESHFLTVAVDAPEGTLLVRNETVGPWGALRVENLVRRRGTYRVVVETAAGDRVVHGWVVWPGVEGFRAFVDEDGLSTEQSVFCTPACQPLSTGGTAADLPYEAADAGFGTRTATLLVENATGADRGVSLSVDDRGTTVLDYDYDLPPGVGVQLPVTRTPGELGLRVASDGEAFAATWHVPEEGRLRLRVDEDAVAPDCEGRSPGVRLGRVRNGDDVAHTVEVALLADGAVAASQSYDLPPAVRAGTVPSLDGPADSYGLRVSVDGDRALAATWTVCPPEDGLSVEVDREGVPRLFSPTRGLVRV
jgi:hypothetical protein